MPTRRRVLLFALLPLAGALGAQGPATTWKEPPEPIRSLLLAEETPSVAISPCRRFLLLRHHEPMPGLDVLARPYLKLAGSRIDPKTRGPQLGAQTTKLVLRRLADGSERPLPIPKGHLGGAVWSADGERIAFSRATDAGTELWLVTTADARARKVDGVQLNAVLGAPVEWLPDQRTLLCRLAVDGLQLPEPPAAPAGPNVQETAGSKAQVRTNQDMLQSEYDARCFEVLATCQLARIDAGTLAVERVGTPAMVAGCEPSPDGSFLLVDTVRRPFSYLVPWRSFPSRVEVWSKTGASLLVVAEQPLRDNVPIGGVPTGRRGIGWLPTAPHALTWSEALDGGDPKAKVSPRDAVFVQPEPAAEPVLWFRTEHRFAGLACAEDGRLALMSEFDRSARRQRVWRLDAGDLAAKPILLYERSTQDAYGDPGTPVFDLQPDGRRLLRLDDGCLFRAGDGASKDGSRPFLDRCDVVSGQTQRLWQCAEGRYEVFAGFLDEQRIAIRSESKAEPPNYLQVTLATGARAPLTKFEDPTQQLVAQVQKQLIRYQRADGVALSGTLYLPPGHRPGQKYPTLVWAYPQEFTQASDAGQVRGSPNRWVRLDGTSHLWLLLAGCAVFDDATMPIVGPVRTANDSYVEQLVASAKAAVDELVQRGVTEPGRLAIGGHSYGAFMTANLLCHSDLFATGIARSGAYNRTLTPFGFQNEERTFWEAPEVYLAMSPFAHVQQLNEPILLIHGEDDNNQGTWPLQSQRLFAAIKGHGGTARLVMLPHEAHGYRARESVLHCVAEMVDWMHTWVK